MQLFHYFSSFLQNKLNKYYFTLNSYPLCIGLYSHREGIRMKTFIIVSLLAVMLIFIVLSSGVYNIAASEKHWAITEKLITWARENSIRTRAEELEVPALDEESVLGRGFVHYDAMCTECHLAPGKQPTELAKGLYPKAPVFHERVPVTDAENKLSLLKKYFWVTKHGIKMTAMPAWGVTHGDESIWNITAFIHELHGMTSKRYEEFVDLHSNHDQHGIHHH
jgi:mono/diheme cytochrome c family protein